SLLLTVTFLTLSVEVTCIFFPSVSKEETRSKVLMCGEIVFSSLICLLITKVLLVFVIEFLVEFMMMTIKKLKNINIDINIYIYFFVFLHHSYYYYFNCEISIYVKII